MTKLLRVQPSVSRAELLRWAVFSGLLTLIVLGSAAGSQFRVRFPRWDIVFEPPEMDSMEMAPEPPPIDGMPMAPNLGRNIGIWIVAVTVVVLLGILGYVIFRFFWNRRGRLRDGAAELPEETANSGDTPVQFSKEDVADIVAVAQARMAQAGNPSDAVVAGWLAFEDAAATRGWVREPHETTTEFTNRLLSASPVPPPEVATLRGLYQRVRFGGQVPTDDDVAAAHTALVNIAESLRNVLDDRAIATLRTATTVRGVAAAPGANAGFVAGPIKAGVTRNKWGED